MEGGVPGSVAGIAPRRGEDSRWLCDLTVRFLPEANASVVVLGLLPGFYQFSKDICTCGFWGLTDTGLGALAQYFNFFCLKRCEMLGTLGRPTWSSFTCYYPLVED